MPLYYLVRHGQTEFNLAGKMQGRCDSPLTALGREQVQKSADELKNVSFTHCYHSPLGRTCETAEILLQHHPKLKMQPDERFIEIGFGQWEGTKNRRKDHQQIRSEEETELHNLWFAPAAYKGSPPDGENFYQLQERLYNGVKSLQQQHAVDDTILIVSHCAAIRSFLNKCIQREMNGFWDVPRTDPASISIVQWDVDGDPVVLSYSGTPMV